MTRYLTAEEVLQLHEFLIGDFGGLEGIRDRNGLESAVARLQTGYYGDVIEEAAALFESLSQNHPFVDGNKRTGFVVGILFMELNGYQFTASQEDAAQAVLELASGKLDEAAYAAFLRSNSFRGRNKRS